ncbi:MAG: hypothetical protein H6Q99_1059 [Proteobacteria bacterium]|nr:hypothetical protein [Pseudomonadota bacterium]
MQLLKDILLTVVVVAVGIFIIRRSAHPSRNNGSVWFDGSSDSNDCDGDGGDSCD